MTSLPTSLNPGASIGGFATAATLIAIGVGGVKSTVSPFIGVLLINLWNGIILTATITADQYTNLKPRFKTTEKGERVIADRSMTIQYIYNVYYWRELPFTDTLIMTDLTRPHRFVNIVSLSSIATTYLEKERGFWAAYLLPTSFLSVAVAMLLVGHKNFGMQN